MERNRERSRCCGAGAGVKSAYPEIALEVASKRINDAINIEAEIMATTCSFCILNLDNALDNIIKTKSKDGGPVLKVMDLTELILMGLENEEI